MMFIFADPRCEETVEPSLRSLHPRLGQEETGDMGW
jgi:hypothetical protein